MPINSFKTDCFDRKEEELLEYVIALADIIVPDIAYDCDGNACKVDSQAPRIFKQRYNQELLDVYDRYEEYIRSMRGENNLIDIVNALGIDIEKFWYLLLFVTDYVVGSTINTLRCKNSPKEDIEKFIHFVKRNEEDLHPIKGFSHKQPMTLTLWIKGRKLVIDNPTSISMIAQFCKEGLPSIHTDSILNSMECEENYNKSQSVRIWLFAKLFRQFFDLYPQFCGKKRMNDSVSKSKLLLIAKLVYFVGLTENDDYNSDDECLKAIIKQYKEYEIDTVNKFYM